MSKSYLLSFAKAKGNIVAVALAAVLMAANATVASAQNKAAESNGTENTIGGIDNLYGVRGKVIFGGVKVEHGAAVPPQRDRALLVVAYFAPCLDNVLLVIGHIVQFHGVGIFVVLQGDDGFGAAVHGLSLHPFVAQVGGHVAIGMGYGHCRLKVVLVARCRTHLVSACAHGAV